MIYFDHAATTPLSAPARLALLDAFDHITGNPSSAHRHGLAAERAVRRAADTLSQIIGCMPEEIIFTSGGTESNNLAILGAAARFLKRGGHILSTPLEHPSVMEPLRHLADKGIAVTFAPVSTWDEMARPDTFLASVSHVYSETGDCNDIARAAATVKRINPHALVHVDGVQGFCKETGGWTQADLYSFSAHKIGGPKGVGGLMVRRGTRMAPLFYGGGQQAGLRPGTENVPGIVALAAAAQEYRDNIIPNRQRVMAVRSALAAMTGVLPDVFINHAADSVSPYILNMSFVGIKGETLVNFLSEQDICIAAGAACRTRKNDRSPLYALGLDEARVSSAVRFSFSPASTVEEAERVKCAVIEGVNRLRRLC